MHGVIFLTEYHAGSIRLRRVILRTVALYAVIFDLRRVVFARSLVSVASFMGE